jgi:hypothetical protein
MTPLRRSSREGSEASAPRGAGDKEGKGWGAPTTGWLAASRLRCARGNIPASCGRSERNNRHRAWPKAGNVGGTIKEVWARACTSAGLNAPQGRRGVAAGAAKPRPPREGASKPVEEELHMAPPSLVCPPREGRRSSGAHVSSLSAPLPLTGQGMKRGRGGGVSLSPFHGLACRFAAALRPWLHSGVLRTLRREQKTLSLARGERRRWDDQGRSGPPARATFRWRIESRKVARVGRTAQGRQVPPAARKVAAIGPRCISTFNRIPG